MSAVPLKGVPREQSEAEQFRAFAASHGFALPPKITPGRWVNFQNSANGDQREQSSYRLLLNGSIASGSVKSFRGDGARFDWVSTDAPTPADLDKLRRMAEEADRADSARGEAAARDAREMYERLPEAGADHPYLTAKKISAVPGLRVYSPLPDSPPNPAIAGMALDGALVVPIYAADGLDMVSVEFIQGDGAKRFYPGAKLPKGHTFRVGAEPTPGEPVIVAEGAATAASVHELTGHPAFAAFSAQNQHHVVTILRARHPDNPILLAAEPGEAGQKAATACAALGALPVLPPGNSGDWNDACAFLGVPAAREAWALGKARQAAQAEAHDKVRLLPHLDLATINANAPGEHRFLIENFLPAHVLTHFAAHGGKGKSFVSLYIAISLAAGRPVFGQKSERCRVAVYSAEDDTETLKIRIGRYCKALGIVPESLTEWLFVHDATGDDPALFRPVTVGEGEARRVEFSTTNSRALADTLVRNRIDLLIVDGASDTFDDDEIKRARVRAFINHLTGAARKVPGGAAAVLLLAHVNAQTSMQAPSDKPKGYSGSTAWHNSSRSRWFMYPTEKETVLEVQKLNFGAEGSRVAVNWDATHGVYLPGAASAPQSRHVWAETIYLLVSEMNRMGRRLTFAAQGADSARVVIAATGKLPSSVSKAEIHRMMLSLREEGRLRTVEIKNKDSKVQDVWEVVGSSSTKAKWGAE